MKEQSHQSNSFFISEKSIKENGLTYSDIGKACKVSEKTICEWISQKDIPQKYTIIIQQLLKEARPPIILINQSEEEGFTFRLSIEDQIKLSRKAMECGCSLEELIAKQIDTLLQ